MENHLKVATILVNFLENRFRLLGIRFGFDPIIGLIPGFGDFISLLLSFYLIWIAVELKIPSSKITQMLFNILLDFLLGLIPVLGDFVDVVYRANTRNLAIIKKYKPAKIIEGKEVE